MQHTRLFWYRFAAVLGVFVLLFGYAAPVARAIDPYADGVVDQRGIQDAEEAIGEPDETSALFALEDDMITLALAAGEHGVGGMTLYYETAEDEVEITVSIYSITGSGITESVAVTLDGDDTSVDVELDETDTMFNRLRIVSDADAEWGLDAVEVGGFDDTDEDGMPDEWEDRYAFDPDDEDDADEDADADGLTNLEEYEANTNPTAEDTDEDGSDDAEEIDEDTDPNDASESPDFDLETGDLIKVADNSAVYFIGLDGYRHAFPHSSVFFSWFADFDDVETIEAATLSHYRLGHNVTMRPGTSLVKIDSVDTVYAVEPGGELVAIPDEDIAEVLYGEDWADRVIDVSSAFWSNYHDTEEELDEVYPNGTLLEASDGTMYYIEEGEKREIDEDVFDDWSFDEDDVLTEDIIADIDDVLDEYDTGDDFGDEDDEALLWSY